MSKEMEAFINGGSPPQWYIQFKEANRHLLSEDGKEFVFSADRPLTIGCGK
jgi:hypothetical protein